MSWIDPASLALGLVIGAAAVAGVLFGIVRLDAYLKRRDQAKRPAEPPRGWQ